MQKIIRFKITIKESILILFLVPLCSIGQNLKTYSGTYEKGKATYQYYEKANGERVFQGKFHYECEDFGDNYPYQTIDGIYENGKKTGMWLFKHESKGSNNFTSTIKKTIVFKSDLYSGEYIADRYYSETKNGVFNKVINYKNKFNYTNGKPIGAFSIEDFYPLKNILIGSIDSLGFADGEWKIKNSFVYSTYSGKPNLKFECVRIYSHGLLLSSNIFDAEKGTKINDEGFNGNPINNPADTSFLKLQQYIVLNEAFYDLEGNDRVRKTIGTMENVITEKINNNQTGESSSINNILQSSIPFDYLTLQYKLKVTITAVKAIENLSTAIKNYNKNYIQAIDKAYIPYTGNYTFLKDVSGYSAYESIRADTCVLLNSTCNRYLESLSKIKILSNSFNYAFKNEGSITDNLIDYFTENNIYLSLFNEKNPESFIKINITSNFNTTISKLNTEIENAFSEFKKYAPQYVTAYRKQKTQDSLTGTITKLEMHYRKNIDEYKRNFDEVLNVRVTNKNLSIENSYINQCYLKFRTSLDLLTKEISNETDLSNKNILAIKRDSLLIESKTFVKAVAAMANKIAENLVRSRGSNDIIKINGGDLELINPTFYKKIYSIFIPETVEQIANAYNPKTAVTLLHEIETILNKVEEQSIKNNEEFAKKLKKCKNKDEILLLIQTS